MLNQSSQDEFTEQQNHEFLIKADGAFRSLFDSSRLKNELHFAFSLTPELRGMESTRLNTTVDTFHAFDDYLDFIQEGEFNRLKARVALGFYSHLSEASGFYEVPKNMLRVAEGNPYLAWPFHHLVQTHKVTGNMIAPNANTVLKDLAGHAKTLGFNNLSEVFRDAFNSDLRNGYAHADYVVLEEGIFLRKRNGGRPILISWPKFNGLFERGINFFQCLRRIVNEYVFFYNPPKTISGSLTNEQLRFWTIKYDPQKKTFSISG